MGQRKVGQYKVDIYKLRIFQRRENANPKHFDPRTRTHWVYAADVTKLLNLSILIIH